MRHELDIINDWKSQETSKEQDIAFLREYIASAEYQFNGQHADLKKQCMKIIEYVLFNKRTWCYDWSNSLHHIFECDNIKLEFDFEAPAIRLSESL